MIADLTPVKGDKYEFNTSTRMCTIVEFSKKLESQYGEYRTFRIDEDDTWFKVKEKSLHNLTDSWRCRDVVEISFTESQNPDGKIIKYISSIDFKPHETINTNLIRRLNEATWQELTTKQEVVVEALSGLIPSSYGVFRVIKINGNPYAFKPWRVENPNDFTTNCLAEITTAVNKRQGGTYIKMIKFLKKD